MLDLTIKGVWSATPNSTYCFNKTGFLIFFIDMYFMWFYFVRFVARRVLLYVYLWFKVMSIIMPYAMLSPAGRLPF